MRQTLYTTPLPKVFLRTCNRRGFIRGYRLRGVGNFSISLKIFNPESNVMQNQIQVFSNENFGSVRVLGDSQNPLFCLADVCKVLEIQNTSDVKNSILKEFELPRLNLYSFDSGFGIKEFSMITEPQLYFVLMRSDKPKAKPFRQWLVNIVIPSLRQNGGYIMGQEQMSESELLAQALMVANNVIERKSKELERARMQIEIDKPKIFIYENLMDSKSNRTIQEFARDTKHIHNLLQRDIFKILNEKNFIFKNPKGVWTPYAHTIERGLMEIRYSTYEIGGVTYSKGVAMITPKGVAHFIKVIQKVIEKGSEQ